MNEVPKFLFDYLIIDGDLQIFTLKHVVGTTYWHQARKIHYHLTPFRDEESWLAENNVFLTRLDVLVDIGDYEYDYGNVFNLEDIEVLFEDEFGDEYDFKLEFEEDDEEVN